MINLIVFERCGGAIYFGSNPYASVFVGGMAAIKGADSLGMDSGIAQLAVPI